MKRLVTTITAIAALLCGCTGQKKREGAAILDELEKLPTGLKVVHSPSEVRGPNEGLNTGWRFSWSFRTEVHAIEKRIKIVQFGIAAWDGFQWVLPLSQNEYNNGVLDAKTFEQWYGKDAGIIVPGDPAIDPQNWAGSHLLKDFKQKWFFIGVDETGKKWKGEGIVALVVR
jgi:hypothetical protein